MNPSDPVAISIEKYLHRQAEQGLGRFAMCERPDDVTIRFGTACVHGENYDIALVRLARVLLDDERFRSDLMDCLREATPV